ncbi:MAG: pilus assembly protein [Bdellovibrionales bacterium]|nr:pilus assembly protein [Bdellovibrionales bacterium]
MTNSSVFISSKHLKQLPFSNKRACFQQGTALTEFALIAPLMMFIGFGLVRLGQNATQVNWVAEASYEAAVELSLNTEQLGIIKGQRKFETLKNLQSHRLASSAVDLSVDQGNGIVKIDTLAEVEGNNLILNEAFRIVDRFFAVKYTAPSLVGDSGIILGDQSTFAQGVSSDCQDYTYYDCNGNAQCTPATDQCDWF